MILVTLQNYVCKYMISQVMFKNKTDVILIYGILQKVTNTHFW